MNVNIQAARELLLTLRDAYRMLPKRARTEVVQVLVCVSKLEETDIGPTQTELSKTKVN